MITMLDSDAWQLREALGLTWQWYVRASAPGAGNSVADAVGAVLRTPGWLDARVPGSVVHDLVRLGEVDEPRIGRRSRGIEWVADRSWVYRRGVAAVALEPGERAVLEFDGIDPGGEVYWDGERLGRVDGLYHRARFDVTAGMSEATEHVLAVVVAPAPASEPQVGRTEAVRVHSPRMNYGWDFSPRMRHQGIWKSVRLVTGAVHLAEVIAHTELNGRQSVVRVRASVEAHESVLVEAHLLDGDAVVGSGSVSVSGGGGEAVEAALDLTLDDPVLWWPNGLGEQKLYELRVSAHDAPVFSCSLGFREIRMVGNPDAPDGALAYSAEINGIPSALLGWNWVPADSLYGTVTRERIDHLIELAVRSGARLLRVWGGGLIETEAFYDACDTAGLLVWQEFSQSSSGMQSAPATDDDFVALMRSEAEAIVPTLSRHPSLAIWGGGNELDDGAPLTEARSPVLAALGDAVRRLDPTRHWLPTSPTGPEANNLLERIDANPGGQHDVHGPWEHQGLEAHYTLYNRGTSLAHTEFGVEGMTNARTLEALIPEEDRWPTDRSNPVYRHLGEWWNNAELVQESFGGKLDTVERMRRASQFLQAAGLGYAVEADRRRAPRCSMVLPWQLNESFPNAWCTAVVDHRGDTKPAYDAVTRAYRPERATIRVDRMTWGAQTEASASVWLWSEPGREAGGEVVLRVLGDDGSVVAESRQTLGAVSRPSQAAELTVELRLILAVGSTFFWQAVWSAQDGTEVDNEVSVASAAHDLSGLLGRMPATVSTALEEAEDDTWRVTLAHLAGPVVLGVRLVDDRPVDAPGWVVIDGDPRPLVPGEVRCLGVRWRDGAGRSAKSDTERRLRLEAWNAADRPLLGKT